MWLSHNENLTDIKRVIKSELNEPKNNDGRESCFWCGGKLKDSQGFLNTYKVCVSCGK
jgi:hypothetical protein